MQSISSLLHVRKLFEVGISESLQERLDFLDLDIVEKVMGWHIYCFLLKSMMHFVSLLSFSLSYWLKGDAFLSYNITQACSCISMELVYVYELVSEYEQTLI